MVTTRATVQQYVEAHDRYTTCRTEVLRYGGDFVRVCRNASGMSVRKYAVVIGVSPSFLSKVERGLELLPPDVARRILEVVGK